MTTAVSCVAVAGSVVLLALTLGLRHRLGMTLAWPTIVVGLVCGLANHAMDLLPGTEPRQLVDVFESIYLPAGSTIFLALGVTLHLVGLARAGRFDNRGGSAP